MTEEQDQMLREVHDFLFRPTMPGSDLTRAKQIEELLSAARSGKFAARFILWIAGAVTSVAAAMVIFRGTE